MSGWEHFFMVVGFSLVIFAVVSGWRLLWGPSAPDRVVALDTINTIVVAAMVVLGAAYDDVIYVDVAIVYAALSFIEVLFIAKYLEREV